MPMAIPIRILPMMNMAKTGERTTTNVPAMKISDAARMELRRPTRSERGPPKSAPMIAPISTALTATSVVTLVRLNSSLMKRIAPEMTPVSNPKRIPATAAITATTRTIPVILSDSGAIGILHPAVSHTGVLPGPIWEAGTRGVQHRAAERDEEQPRPRERRGFVK